MKITEIAIKNVRALPDLDRRLVDGGKRPFDVVLVTGPTGSGKTRLLEAIATWKEAVGPYGVPLKLESLEKRPGGGYLSGAWELTEDDVKRAQLPGASVRVRVDVGKGAKAPEVPAGLGKVLSTFSRDARHGKMEYFPAGRRLSKAPLPVPLDALSEATEASIRLTKDGDKYGVERAWIHEKLAADVAASQAALSSRGVLLSGDAPDSLAAVRVSIARMVPHLRLAGLGGTGPKAAVRFARADGFEVDIGDLSDGEQQGVLFAAAFHRLGLSRSVVLIDTPELFVAPADQARFFGALRALGTDNQIIAATCSPAILASVPPEQIIDLASPEQRA